MVFISALASNMASGWLTGWLVDCLHVTSFSSYFRCFVHHFHFILSSSAIIFYIHCHMKILVYVYFLLLATELFSTAANWFFLASVCVCLYNTSVQFFCGLIIVILIAMTPSSLCDVKRFALKKNIFPMDL